MPVPPPSESYGALGAKNNGKISRRNRVIWLIDTGLIEY